MSLLFFILLSFSLNDSYEKTGVKFKISWDEVDYVYYN